MQNTDGQTVDLLVPRKCSGTNRLITPTDHAAVQINIACVDEDGKMTGKSETFAFCGFLRAQGEADAALARLTKEAHLLDDV